MSIEGNFERIANALEELVKIAKVVNKEANQMDADIDASVKPKTEKKTAVKKTVDNTDITVEQITDALRECVVKVGAEETKKVLASFGATRIPEIKVEDRLKCYQTLKEKANG